MFIVRHSFWQLNLALNDQSNVRMSKPFSSLSLHLRELPFACGRRCGTGSGAARDLLAQLLPAGFARRHVSVLDQSSRLARRTRLREQTLGVVLYVVSRTKRDRLNRRSGHQTTAGRREDAAVDDEQVLDVVRTAPL